MQSAFTGFGQTNGWGIHPYLQRECAWVWLPGIVPRSLQGSARTCRVGLAPLLGWHLSSPGVLVFVPTGCSHTLPTCPVPTLQGCARSCLPEAPRPTSLTKFPTRHREASTPGLLKTHQLHYNKNEPVDISEAHAFWMPAVVRSAGFLTPPLKTLQLDLPSSPFPQRLPLVLDATQSPKIQCKKRYLKTYAGQVPLLCVTMWMFCA